VETVSKFFALHENHPNPYNQTTTIKYEIPDQARNDNALVTLKVYDVLGNEVITLVNEELSAGSYEIEFNLVPGIRNPTSGVYFYQLKASFFAKTKKMILMK
jgi:hypothetical protein